MRESRYPRGGCPVNRHGVVANPGNGPTRRRDQRRPRPVCAAVRVLRRGGSCPHTDSHPSKVAGRPARHGTLSLKRLLLPGAVGEVRDRCRARAQRLAGYRLKCTGTRSGGRRRRLPAAISRHTPGSVARRGSAVPTRASRRRYPADSDHSAQLTVIRCSAPDRGRAQLDVGAPSRFSLPPLAVRVRAASKSGGRFWRKASMPS